MALSQRGIYIDNAEIIKEINFAIKKIEDFLKRENSVVAKRYYLGKKNVLTPFLKEFEPIKSIDFQNSHLNFQLDGLRKAKVLNDKVEIEIINFENEEQKTKLTNEIKNLEQNLQNKKDELADKNTDIETKRKDKSPFLQKALDDKDRIEREIRLIETQIKTNQNEITDIQPEIVANSSLDAILGGTRSYDTTIVINKLEYIEKCIVEIESILKQQLGKKIIIVDDSALINKPLIIFDLLKQFNIVIIPDLVIETLKFQTERGRYLNKEHAKQTLDILNTIDRQRITSCPKLHFTDTIEQIKIISVEKAKEDISNEVFVLSENPALQIPNLPDNLKIIKSDFLETGFKPTDEQQKVLNLKQGLHLVLAPPGSGKTELLAQRVYGAIDDGYKDSDIICLTFTNRAAKGMKERIEKKYPNNKIIIGNFHKYAINFLKTNRLIPLNASILDEEEQDQIIKEIKERFKYANNVYNPELIKLATYEKQQELGFSDDILLTPKYSEIPDLQNARKVCEAYIKEKQDNDYLDFDDLLTRTYYNLTHSEKDKLQIGQFKWVQVDEVQDLNPIQWAILHEITAHNALIVYFGDYEQAIFSFMGAKLESLHTIEQIVKKEPQKNSILNLCKNFRSPSYLLDIYVKYAETHWRPSWKQRPFSHKQQEAPADALRIFEINGTNYTEAEYIAQHIMPQMLVNDEKTAIIVKENYPADIISNALKQRSIPHFKISGFDLFRRKSVKGLMAFLSLLYNEFDRLSWARIFHEFASLSLKDSRLLVNNLFKKGLTPIDILSEHNTNILLQHGLSTRTSIFFDIFSYQEMIVFDTEATGLDTDNDDIIQIAAVKIRNGKIESTFEVYIKTDKDIAMSEEVHHITREYLNENGVSAKEGLDKFMSYCGENCVLVAHNIKYDYDILNSNLTRYCNQQLTNYCCKCFDSIEITKLLYPNLNSYKLKDLIEFLKIDGVNSHNALDDVKATVSLIEKLNTDYTIHFKDAQSQFLQDADNITVFKRLIKNFHPIFTEIQTTINTYGQLRSIVDRYFEFTKIEKEEKQEVEKLTEHLNFYTNIDYRLTLKEKIHKYIPEYLLYKESDLYRDEQIVVSTVYKAKGLEFDNVVIADATDEMYPRLWALKKSLNTAKTQDERKSIQEQMTKKTLEDARAFYVAMTRAKKKLHITIPTRNQWGYKQEPSRFISCIQNYFIT